MNSSSNNDLSREQLLDAVLASDLAAEVAAEFKGRRSVGLNVPAATQHVLNRFHSALSSPQDGPIVLLALAVLQLRDGSLQSVIRDAALDLIGSGEALAAHRSDDFNQRKQTRDILERVESLLAEADCVPE